LNWLLKRNANVHTKRFDSTSPLHIAISQGHLEVASTLLHKGAHLNEKGRMGFTAALIAVWKGDRKIIKWLNKRGADFNARVKNFTCAEVYKDRFGRDLSDDLRIE